ncbi:unnamed protein product [Bursaphelenchus xylophilus]|uniref:Acireductone dioxygenase n=1 Tax=Bursaphelenchus xylophilus TaxID=6326 RepID=A0A1I7S016_BURXY|nr:unnamed protein product [Bursaphelenchus xylophilus]CAG9109084.1 unnamed protein product [Bursaphelenchus xylophilus]
MTAGTEMNKRLWPRRTDELWSKNPIKLKMVQAWYMEANPANSREECQLNPPEPVSLEKLKEIGALVDYLDPANREKELEPLALSRGYTYSDEIIVSKEKLPQYEEKVKNFFTEHLHTDDEIRYIIDGCGYFDIRDDNDRWIRIKSEPGDLITIPAGSYHRFSPDLKDYIQVKRLFQGVPVWTAHNRELPDTKEMPIRKQYTQRFSIKA